MASVINSDNVFFEELKKSIDGYSGYSAPEERESTDKIFRKYLSTELHSVKNAVTQLKSQLNKNAHHKLTDIFQHVTSSLTTNTESLVNPCYYNHAFFSQPDLGAVQLNDLYDYDSHLQEQVHILKEETGQLIDQSETTEISELLNHFYNVIDGINQLLTEREFIIMGAEE